MKKIITILFFAFCGVVAIQAKDISPDNEGSLLSVHLEKDNTASWGIYLTFTNNSNDTIFTQGVFRYFRDEDTGGSGFFISCFRNGILSEPQADEVPMPDYYVYSKRIIKMPPKTTIKFPIDLTYFFYTEYDEDEYGVQLILRYSYSKLGKEDKVQIFRTKTNYLVLKEKGISLNKILVIPLDSLKYE